MKSIRSRGFTLIELLVVIAIIGLLASIILASLNTAQQKGRDARRVSDLQEIGQAIVTSDSGGTGVTFTGCTVGDVAVSTCLLTGATLSGYVDPSTATVCGAAKPTSASSPCNYTMYTASPTTQNYEICGVLETGSGTLPKGPIYIASSTAGSVLTGCP